MITKAIESKLIKKENFEIQIWDITYKVKFDRDLAHTNEVFWQHNYNIQTIFLQPDINLSKLRNTFIHEVLHWFFATSGMTYDENISKYEEYITRMLAEHINLFELNNL